jgi:N-methylhydantoinase B
MPATLTRPDPTTISTVWHALQRACWEMRYVIDRTGQSYLMTQLHDISVGLWDAQARTVAVPVGLPVQFLAGKFAVRYLLDKFGDDIHPGDIFLSNDPYHGHTCHLPDWGFFKPIFAGDRLLFFALARGHQMDTGGSYPGAYFPNGYDIHAEGIAIPPTRIFDRGKERTDVLELIWNNVRYREAVKMDNYAMIAALNVAERRAMDTVERYGVDTVLACVEEMYQRTERAVREEIRRIPDGTYHGEAATDDDGTVHDEPVWVRCAATVQGDELTLDFSASDDQRKGFVNAIYASTYSISTAGMFLFLDPALADFHNEGSMQPVTIIAPEGKVVNARYPATVGASPVNVGRQIMESTVMALSQAVPGKAVAAWGRRWGHYLYGTDLRSDEPYLVTTFDPDGSAGAVYGYDGYQGAVSLTTLGSVARGNVEELESRFPWRCIKYELAPDSAGAGRWAGGNGIHWEWLNEGSEAGMATGSAEGQATFGHGALGGRSTPPSRAWIKRHGESIQVDGHRMYKVQTGDVLLKISGGGAGVGDPLEREPKKVQRDVRDGLLSIQRAREDYGVVLDAGTLQVDEAATAAVRAELRAT